MGIITYNGLTGIVTEGDRGLSIVLGPVGCSRKSDTSRGWDGYVPRYIQMYLQVFTSEGSNIMSWGQHRRGRHVSIAVPPEIKCQLIRNKALGGGGIGAQIVEALQYKWGTVPMAPRAVIKNPIDRDRVESGRFKGMRSQSIDKTTIPWQI